MEFDITRISFLFGAVVAVVVRFWLAPKFNLLPKDDNDFLGNVIFLIVFGATFFGPFLGMRALLSAFFG